VDGHSANGKAGGSADHTHSTDPGSGGQDGLLGGDGLLQAAAQPLPQDPAHRLSGSV